MASASQQIAQSMLERTAWRDQPMEYWLSKMFPRVIDHALTKCQSASRAPREILAEELGILALRQNLGSSKFEIAYQQTKEALILNPDDKLAEQFSDLTHCRDQFHKLKDMSVKMGSDILPTLQALRDGTLKKNLTPKDVIYMHNNCNYIVKEIGPYVPERMRIENPQETYNQFAEGMRSLLKCAYLDEQRIKMANGFAANVQKQNRLNDYWRDR
jgi:hypothetical protein